MDDWDRGRWCDICHQKHYQISPACERRRKERKYAASEEGQRALKELAARLVVGLHAPKDRAQEGC